MARINEAIPQDEATNTMFQALGMLLMEFQTARGSDHLELDFQGFTYKVGVREGGLIDLEKHELEVRTKPSKLVTLDEFADGK